MELATAILSKEPSVIQPADAKNLREWAVQVINKFSGVTMSGETAAALIKTTAFANVVGASGVTSDQADSQGTWASSLAETERWLKAKHETNVTAKAMGIRRGTVFRRQGSFRSVKVFVNRAEAEEALGKARSERSTRIL